jgi:DNA-binding MarR family transcriptional regulator
LGLTERLSRGRGLTMSKIEPIVPQDKRVIEALMSALMPFNDFQTQMPLAYMLSFLAVVRDEGKPIGVYARELDLERFIIGRYFQVLGDRGRHGTPGLGLVKVKRTQAHQFKTEVHLTAKGRAVVAQVVQNFRRFTQQ